MKQQHRMQNGLQRIIEKRLKDVQKAVISKHVKNIYYSES
jgi:hypothetical protein